MKKITCPSCGDTDSLAIDFTVPLRLIQSDDGTIRLEYDSPPEFKDAYACVNYVTCESCGEEFSPDLDGDLDHGPTCPVCPQDEEGRPSCPPEDEPEYDETRQRLPACYPCRRWQATGFPCGKGSPQGECDCPKCQGLCRCHDGGHVGEVEA